MTFKQDLKLRESVFRKMGWEKVVWSKEKGRHKNGKWVHPDNFIELEALPPIETSWEVCTEYLVSFMDNKGWKYRLEDNKFVWARKELPHYTYADYGIQFAVTETIKNDNIALAACQAFMEVEICM